MKQLSKFTATLWILPCIFLASCSSPANKNVASGIVGQPETAQASSAQTFGSRQSQAQYQSDQLAQTGPQQNPMQAPSNQTYYFGFDHSSVLLKDMAALNNQANYLATHPAASVRLEGNTDNRGSREYNIALGWRRDQAVARVMELQGVKPKQLQMVSYGKERPAVLANNEQAWALNRRVSLVYKAAS